MAHLRGAVRGRVLLHRLLQHEALREGRDHGAACPTTWDGLVTLAKKLKAKGITPFEFGEKEGYFGAWTQDALISGLDGNTGVLNMYTGKQTLNSLVLDQALHRVARALRRGPARTPTPTR